MMNAPGASSATKSGGDTDYAPRRLRIEVAARRYWQLRALQQSTGSGDDVGEVLGYLAASLRDGLERSGSWEADVFNNLFEERPYEPPPPAVSALTDNVVKAIEFDISEFVHRRLEQFAVIAGAGSVPALMDHVVMVVCNGMDGAKDWTRRLFGQWPLPQPITCPQCHSDVFEERDLVVFPEGNLCPRCVEDYTCSNCRKRLTKDEADVVEFDGALCNPCRAAHDAADATD